ncbi:MAG: TonB-dependent receptor [Bacteroidota bacterium]
MRLICVLVLMLLSFSAFSQEEAFYIQFKEKALLDVITEVEDTYSVLFSFKDEYTSSKKVSLNRERRTLDELLFELEEQTGLYYKIVGKRYIIVNVVKENSALTHNLDQIVIKSFLTRGIEKNRTGEYNINPTKLGVLPGLTEPDILESIQLLPGVLSPNETATGFFVRGGASDQNRVIWDGITIYHKGHLFGMLSPLNPNITSELNFINKGTHSRYGERLSSVTDIKSDGKIDNTFKAQAGINGINVDALVEVPLVDDKLNVQAALRRSYTDVLETFTFQQLSNKVFENTKISQEDEGSNDFSFSDFNVKINYKPNAKNALYASLISIQNDLDYVSGEEDSDRRFNDLLEIDNQGYGLGWNFQWRTNLSLNVEAFFSDYALNYNFITTEGAEQVSDFEKRNSVFDSGISAELNYQASKQSTLDFGYQYTLKDVSYAFVNTTDLSFVLDTEQSVVQTHSAFGQWYYKNPKLVDISVGLRTTYFKELNAVRLEPRILMFKSLNKRFKLQASAEIKNQIISEIDETVFSDLSLENSVWRLSNGSDFPIINSKHVSAGLIYSKGGFSVDGDVYYKSLSNVNSLTLGFLNPSNSGFNIGDQNIVGADIFVNKRFMGFNSWVSYSFNNSQSRFKNLNENRSFKSKSNVTHAISTALGYKLNNLQMVLGWKWQTGRPFTIAQTRNEELVFNDGINTGELPVYHRLDFSSTYSFKMSKTNKLRAKVGFSIRNIYNRDNLIGIEYRGNNNLNDSVESIERFGIGITPNVLFRVYW